MYATTELLQLLRDQPRKLSRQRVEEDRQNLLIALAEIAMLSWSPARYVRARSIALEAVTNATSGLNYYAETEDRSEFGGAPGSSARPGLARIQGGASDASEAHPDRAPDSARDVG